MTDQSQGPFKRSMHGFGALMITLSALSPAIGVFAVGSNVIHQAGTAVFPAFVLAVLVGITIANSYGELGSAFPDTGGEYTIIGRTLGPAAGFAMLGNNLVGFTLANALVGLSMTKYLAVLAPGLPAIPTAIALVAVVTGMAVLNIRVNALVTGLFLAAELAALAAVAVLGFAHPHRGFAEAALSMQALDAHGALAAASPGLLGVAAVAALYAFNGYGSTVFLGEEMHEPRKRLARVVFWALGIGAVTELIPMLAILVGAPDLRALIASASPVPYFAQTVGGPVWGKIVSLCVALANFNCMIVVAVLGARQLYATGRDQVWPAPVSRSLASLHPRFNSPWVATLVGGACAIAFCFLPYDLLELLLASGVAATYSLMCLGALKGRLTGATANAGYRMPLFPLLPLIGLVALMGAVWASLLDEKSGRPGLIAIAVILIAAAGYYWVFLRKSAWGHRGPAAE